MVKVAKTDDEWRGALTDAEYEITRNAGTERAFTGVYWDTKTPGVYNCKCCDTPLFDSTSKYDSGSGWPSFTAPISDEVVVTTEDDSMGMRRIEVRCAACDAHLGHVFPDGPGPDGMRFCLNSASLNLDEEQAS
jgi:peptide-methionine (R)-S-oxide reductase